jgi:hypothetical protein
MKPPRQQTLRDTVEQIANPFPPDGQIGNPSHSSTARSVHRSAEFYVIIHPVNSGTSIPEIFTRFCHINTSRF